MNQIWQFFPDVSGQEASSEDGDADPDQGGDVDGKDGFMAAAQLAEGSRWGLDSDVSQKNGSGLIEPCRSSPRDETPFGEAG